MRAACHRDIVRLLGRAKQRHILQQEQLRLQRFLKTSAHTVRPHLDTYPQTDYDPRLRAITRTHASIQHTDSPLRPTFRNPSFATLASS